MNENLDLVEILKDCPNRTKLYSTLHGEVELLRIYKGEYKYPIKVLTKCKTTEEYTSEGKYYCKFEGECLLFPSKEQRDWSKFKVTVEKFDYSTLKPFDKVLVRDVDCDGIWRVALFSCMLSNGMLCECRWDQGIPYNEETKHLLGTNDMPDEKYIWWEE